VKKNLRDLATMRLHYANVAVAGGSDSGDEDLLDDLLALAIDGAFLSNAWSIRDRDAFERCREAGRPRLGPLLLDIGEQVGQILATAHGIRAALAATHQPNWRASVEDMQAQLDRLVYRGFLRHVGVDRLRHLPRYLKALQLRLGKLSGAAARDQARMQEMAALERQWLQRREQGTAQGGGHDPRLEEIRWLREELRISLFAQELKTAEPVSVKRIAKRWQALGL